MPIRKFIPYHLLFCCIATGIIFWPYMTTLAFGALIAGITIFFTLRAAALATVDGQHALAASIGILIVPGAWWVSTFCIRPLTLDGLQVT